MKISVIIPVYNAAEYVQQAVQSVLEQQSDVEIVLAEDGSTDNSAIICQQLSDEHTQVIFVQHPNQANLGAAAARNLAIENSSGEIITFLDADDYYLAGRFDKALEILEAEPNIDGTYGAMKYHLADDEARTRWENTGHTVDEIQYMQQAIDPDQLFERLCKGSPGWYHINTLTLRRELVERVGCFDSDFPMFEDYVFLMKTAALGRLKNTDDANPVAALRIHATNSFSGFHHHRRKFQTKVLNGFKMLKIWGKQNLAPHQQRFLLSAFVRNVQFLPVFEVPAWVPDFLDRRIQIIRLARYYPELLTTFYFWKELLPHVRRTWQQWRKNRMGNGSI